jgi:hypothetical protein
VTPEGHPFWLRSVYGIDVTDGGEGYVAALKAKYNSPAAIPWQAFATQVGRRLRQWGFNAIGEYSSNYTWPIEAYARGWSNPEKLPFIRSVQPVLYGQQYYKLKDIQYGVDAAVVNGSNGIPALWYAHGFPDVFDPNFATIAATYARPSEFADPALLTGSPWLIGTSLDDRDYLFGFGPSQAHGGWHEHLGWLAAATAPTQTSNPRIWVGATQGVTYTDTKVYTKHAWRDFLRTKYGTVAALNAAWGATYTTWESDGGWPNGRGVLDESGRGAWLGKDYYLLADTHPTAKADLDAFLDTLADKYFATVASAVRALDPNHLVFGPMALSAGAHEAILRAAGRHLDVVQVELSYAVGTEADTLLRRAYDLTQKPLFVWRTFTAQADSALSSTAGWPNLDFPTQEDRGVAYAAEIAKFTGLQASNGDHFVVGIDWWSWTDKVVGGESTNFGLVSNRDNAYDGREAIVAAGVDPWGYPTGGEVRDYGDFLTSVVAAHGGIYATLGGSAPPAPPPPVPSPDASPPTVAITSPTNGGIVPRNTELSVTLSASDNVGVTKVEFHVDGRLRCSITSQPYTCLWKVPGRPGRQVSLQGKAYDAASNVGLSSVLTVTTSGAK